MNKHLPEGADRFLWFDLPVQLVAKFDPAQPRDPAGTHTGGQWTKEGATSDPVLAEQAKTGIAAVEKLLSVARQKIGSTNIFYATWEEIPKDVKAKTLEFFTEEFKTVNPTAQDLPATVFEHLPLYLKVSKVNDYIQAKKLPDAVHLAPEPSHWVTGVEHGGEGDDPDYTQTHVLALKLTELRTDELRRERGLMVSTAKPEYVISGSKSGHGYVITADDGETIGASNTYEQAKINAEEWAREVSERAANTTSENLIDAVWAHWKDDSSHGLGLSLQLAAAREFNGLHRMTPDEIKTAETSARPYGGIPTFQAYARAQWEVTQMVMKKAGEDKVDVYRALMLAGERVDKTTHKFVDEKGDPLSPTNVKTVVPVKPAYTIFQTGLVYDKKYTVASGGTSVAGADTLEEARAKAEAWAEHHLKMQQQRLSFRPAVSFDFAGEHFVAEKRRVVSLDPGGSILDVPPGGWPYESDEVAAQRRLQAFFEAPHPSYRAVYTQLPDLNLRRAGAQSTTGTPSVANDWGGVGELPPDPKRVVLRIEAPATSVLSLPVYGKNIQSEHESVLMGTKDKWVWDAWQHRAPDFASRPLVHKAETEPLEIDLQAEDRGKPHWMTGVNWANVLKWDELQHPRDEVGRFTEGVGHDTGSQEKTTPSDAGTGGSGGVPVPATPSPGKVAGRPEVVPEAQGVANAYNAAHGLAPVQHDYVTLDEARAGSIADAYEALPLDDSQNPEVKAAYEALAHEVTQQYDYIVASGFTFEPWTKAGQPYQTSTEMVEDVRAHKHMYFYTGGEPNQFMAAKDPKTGLSVNEKFRAVHDYFGHAAGGYGFGPRGEENAWMSHSQMLSPLARRALTTETRGQNSWVNFGKQNFDADGNYKNIPPQDRPFAVQKTALLPEQYALLPWETSLKRDSSWDESKHPRDPEGQFTRVAMTSQRAEGDPGHMSNKEVFQHMREFHKQLEALPGVSRVSVKPGVGGWEGGSESMWQIYYRGNGEATKLVASTAKRFNQDAVLLLKSCHAGETCQPSSELSFDGRMTPSMRESIHATMVANGVKGWTWMKRQGQTILRMVAVPQWGDDPDVHQQATATISQQLRDHGMPNKRRVHKVAVSIMEREGTNSYDRNLEERP